MTIASRDTLMIPRHVSSFVKRLAGRPIDKDGVGRFVHTHSDRLPSRYHTFHELSRAQADTAETRRARFNLVKEVFDTGLYVHTRRDLQHG